MRTRLLAAALLVAAAGPTLAQPPKPAEKATDFTKQLSTRVTMDKAFDGKFKDAVKMLAEKYDLPIAVHPQVGEEGPPAGMAVCGAADDFPVKLPRLVNVKVETVLRLVCEQVNAKFLVYPDYIKIVPVAVWLYETGVLPVDPQAALAGLVEDAPLLSPIDLQKSKPLIKRATVTAKFVEKPLGEILDEIAETTGATIALSPQIPVETRRLSVTVRFSNTPVDAAVRTLCEMAGVASIEDANVLLVTTRERAAAKAKADDEKRKALQLAQMPFGAGPGLCANGLPWLFNTAGDPTAELARFKEQNEELRRQIEELRKLIKK